MIYTVYTDASIRRIDKQSCRVGMAAVVFSPNREKITLSWTEEWEEAGDESNLAELLAIEKSIDTIFAQHSGDIERLQLILYTDSDLVLLFFERLVLTEEGPTLSTTKRRSIKYLPNLSRIKAKLDRVGTWYLTKQTDHPSHTSHYHEVHCLSRQVCGLTQEEKGRQLPTDWELSMYPWIQEAFKKGELV